MHSKGNSKMLILTRSPGQVLHIGDDIRITLLTVRGGQVRIGIEAPRDVQIVRDEAKTDEDGNPREANGNR